MSARAIGALFFSCLCLFPLAAGAQTEALEGPPGPEIAESFETNFWRVHDAGVYFRLTAGLAYASSEIDPPARGESGGSESGARLSYQAVLGGFPVGRLALGLHQWGAIGGERGVVSAGPGLTLYFDESENFFLSAAAGANTLYDGAPDVELFDQWGASGIVEVGTGWWVSNHWTVGLSFLGGGSHFDLDGDGVLARSWNIGLALNLSAN